MQTSADVDSVHIGSSPEPSAMQPGSPLWVWRMATRSRVPAMLACRLKIIGRVPRKHPQKALIQKRPIMLGVIGAQQKTHGLLPVETQATQQSGKAQRHDLPQLQALRACWGSLVRRSAPAVPASSASSITRASAAVPATPTSSAAESWRRLMRA